MKRKSEVNLGGVIFTLAAIYMVAAWTVFRFRHPWATETETFICTWQAATFQSVPYEAMRPRGSR